MASSCAAYLFGIWLFDAIAFTSKKTEEPVSTDQLAPEEVDTGERSFYLKATHLENWRHRSCSLRSLERWRRRQRVKDMPSLPDSDAR